MNRDEFLKRFPNASVSTIAKNCADSVAPSSVSKRSAGDESLAEIPGENPSQAKCLVRLTSFRCKLVDERNLHDKAFIDALTTAGAIFDDSPKYCQVEVGQIKVDNLWEQRTEIEITELDTKAD